MEDKVEKSKRETPTQLLINIMEDFGDEEPLDIVVVYSTVGDAASSSICYAQNDIDHFKLMGMLETAKLMIHDDVTKKWEEQ